MGDSYIGRRGLKVTRRNNQVHPTRWEEEGWEGGVIMESSISLDTGRWADCTIEDITCEIAGWRISHSFPLLHFIQW